MLFVDVIMKDRDRVYSKWFTHQIEMSSHKINIAFVPLKVPVQREQRSQQEKQFKMQQRKLIRKINTQTICISFLVFFHLC